MRNWVCIFLVLVGAFSASASTWTVEKDGSGDFTVIQDALDAASPGDSVLVGPGRFEDFRLHTFQPSGGQVMVIMTVETPDLTVLGSGKSLTSIGPNVHVTEVDGLHPGALLLEEAGAGSTVGGFTFENVEYPVTIYSRSALLESGVKVTGIKYGLQIVEGDSVVIADCEFLDGKAIITSSPSVTRPQIRECSFSNPAKTDNAVAIGNGATDALLIACAFNGHSSGITTSLGGSAIVEDCQFSGQEAGALNVSSGSITARNCVIEAGMRFPLRAGQGRLEVYDSVIGGGTLATLVSTTSVYMRNCHFLNGGGLTVDYRGPDFEIVDVRSNWWGTTDQTQIESWINASYDVVLYEPFLQGPVPVQQESFGGLKARFGGGD